MISATLRALLTLAHGPAVERADGTLHGVARTLLPRRIEIVGPSWASTWTVVGLIEIMDEGDDTTLWRLDLTDPGTVNTVKVALCLALGHDPGQHGTSCAWRPLHNGVGLRERVGWYIDGTNGETYFVRSDHAMGDTDEIVSDEIAGECDTIKALVLACRYVVERAKVSEVEPCPAA